MPTGESIIQGLGSHTIPVVVLAVVLAVAVGALLYRYRLMRLVIFLGGFAVSAAAASFLCGGTASLLIGLVAGIGCQFMLPFGAKKEVPKIEENKRAEQLTQPVANAVVSHAWKTGAELEAFIADRKLLHGDILYLIRSLVDAIWQINAVSVSGSGFSSELEKIRESEDRKLLILRFRQGLDSVSLGNFDDIVDRMRTVLAEIVQSCSDLSDYAEKYSALKCAENDSSGIAVDGLNRELVSSLNMLRNDYNNIAQHHHLLRDGFGRFDKIFAGSSLWKNILLGGIGGALDNVTCGVSLAAAELWGDWKVKKDGDYVENYLNAAQDFIAACDRFAIQGARMATECVMAQQGWWNKLFMEEEDLLRKLNEEGVNLDVHEGRLGEKIWRIVAANLAQSSAVVVALAIGRLKEDRLISPQRIDKIVQILRKAGCPIAADGAIAETVARAHDPFNEDRQKRFCAIVEAYKKDKNFYIGKGISQKKLINALRAYGRGVLIDEVLCLFDDTFFGSADEGFVIAINGMCWNAPGKKANFCAWKDMTMIRAPKDDGNIVRINQIDVKVPDRAAAKFANLLSALKTLFVQSNV